jgi:hypothetical protein
MSVSDTQTKPQSRGLIRRKNNNGLQNAALLKVLLCAIAETPKSKDEIKEITGLMKSTVSNWIKKLHVRKGEIKNLVYIAEWGRVGERQYPVALWKLGYNQLDVPKPPRRGHKEYNKAWRLRKKNNPIVTKTEEGIKHVAR